MATTVGAQLGLDEGGDLLAQVRQQWPRWIRQRERIAVVSDFDDLRDWLRDAQPDDADRVLVGLAELASPQGADDLAGAGALAKCLLPGACRLASWMASERRSILPAGIDSATELVAAQLWIEVRSFPFQRGHKVAANVLMNTRAGVLRECGDAVQVDRQNRTWAHTELLEALAVPGASPREATTTSRAGSGLRATADRPGLLIDPTPGPGEIEHPAEELLDVLAWACRRSVISPADRQLLLCLVEEADRVEVRRMGRGYGGLLGNEIAERVAPRLGMSEATVRRHASRSLRALAAAVPAGYRDAG